ncbi:unnamed protein product [Ambrosiozyma monospora]|uniref:V-type proton ATPase subunit C n=1 Tax=Ambrosiozyma monospora TaxID=43982 RepID=A0A9W6YSI3_AMBMO|nr:unnamed protein product [Ambrosiozyma monospora]
MSSTSIIGDYLLISLPRASTDDKPTLVQWLERSINGGGNQVFDQELPKFKVGTLDSLILQSEELAKYDQQLESSIIKTLDIINSTSSSNANGSGFTTVKAPKVDGKLVDQFFENFQWNTSRFRLDKSVEELIKLITNEALTIDSDLKTSYNAYNAAKSNLLAAQRKQTGDLSIKSLHDIVKADDFILDSEHLTTVLLAVPKSIDSQFLNSYETLTQFVIPRSAKKIATDAEFNLYTVSLFKKFQATFLNSAREQKWIPRDFEYSEETINLLKNEYQNAIKEETNLKNDLIRLSKEAYSELVSSWVHVKILETFVESVLRYGLPPDFNCFAIKLLEPSDKVVKAAKDQLIEKFGYLGGNAFATDKNGKVVKDNSLHEYAALVNTEYEPFVLYEVVLH